MGAIRRSENLARRRKLQAAFDPVQPIVNSVEPAADLGAEFGIIAFDMGDGSLDGAQANALLTLFVTDFAQLAAYRAKMLKHQIVDRIAHALTISR